MEVTVPDAVANEHKERIDAIKSEIEQLTIEDREYALDPVDLPDDMQVKFDGNDLPYVSHGETEWAENMVVALDGDDLWIAVKWNSRRGHWKERDFAGDVYDIMEDYGVDKPTGNPKVGVQFSSDGKVAVENVIPNATEAN